MKRYYFYKKFATLAILGTLAGCTHIPGSIKSASSRQAELLSTLDRSFGEQDLAKNCNASFKTATEMEATVKKQGAEIQDRIKQNFVDAVGRAQAFKEKAPEKTAQKEAEAMQALIEQTTTIQTDMARLQIEIEAERGKCTEAVSTIRDMVHSLATAQLELDKFVQSDAKTPTEAFMFNLIESKAIAKKVDEKTKLFQSKMDGITGKLKTWETAFNAVKE
ncbi:MAG: hypothetical protein NTX59_09085 [Elusimicrobia bacterium]|nr:hypothetical protein [Elusimicrobiota bacterium]